ncbi:MAG: hypothetical protein HY553_13055 [Elusimicrobia bacterium]|nr:hypothetical protein [Elusimicrobiota bacterium]
MLGEPHSSGGWKVDREGALRKIQAYQLENPEHFLLSWLRGAVASGARRISLATGTSGLRLGFDGHPLPPDLFEDPLQALLTGDGGQPARYLMQGAVACHRLGLTTVELSSGAGAGRKRLELMPDLRHLTSPANDGAEATVAAVRSSFPLWPFGVRARLAAAARRAVAEFGLGRCAFVCDGKELPELPGSGARLALAGRDGFVAVPARQRSRAAAILYRHGVRAAEIEGPEDVVPVELHLRDDALPLDLALKGVVREPERLFDGAAQEARRLLAEILPGHVHHLQNLIHSEVVRARTWAGGRFSRWLTSWKSYGPSPAFERESDRAGRWIRLCARRLLVGPGPDAGDPLRKALWEAPLFTNLEDRRLSLLDLYRKTAERPPLRAIVGRVPYPFDDSGAVWCADNADLELLRARMPAAVDVIHRIQG